MIAGLCTVHVIRLIAGEHWDLWSLYAFALIPSRFTEAPGSYIPGSEIWSFLTYGLLHADWLHLCLNSVWLLIFGTVVARVLGSARFLLIATLSTIGGGVVMVLSHWGEPVPVIGASAAVSGLMAAAIPIMYAQRGVPLTLAQLLRNRRALMFIVLWLGITLLTGSQGLFDSGSGRIAWEAHVGGFLVGLLTFAAVTRRMHVDGDHAIFR
ncbi:rhomboid family intramembrane serine protease [soil metagenome]